jgi:hypothetical protein
MNEKKWGDIHVHIIKNFWNFIILHEVFMEYTYVEESELTVRDQLICNSLNVAFSLMATIWKHYFFISDML